MDAGKKIKNIMFIVVVANLALMAYVFLGAFSPKPIPMPNPNGYDDFVKAGKIMRGHFRDFSKMDQKQLAEFVATHTEIFQLVTNGLRLECRMPEDFFVRPVYGDGLSGLGGHDVAFLPTIYLAAGRLAQLEGRTNDSAELYLTGIRLCHETIQGGLFADYQAAFAVESVFLREIRSMISSLDLATSKKITNQLEAICNNAEIPEAIVARNEKYRQPPHDLRERITTLLNRRLIIAQRWELDMLRGSGVYRQKALLSLAAHAYALEKSRNPTNTAELVPVYLKKIPRDPMTETNITAIP